MRLMTVTFLSAALLMGVSFPAQAQSLLGGVLGSKGDDAVVTLGSGDAGTSGLVNVGVGGSDQLLDVNVGGSGAGSLATATVGTRDGVGADVNLLDGTARVGVGVGGSGGLLDVDIGVGGPGGSNGNGGNGVLPGASMASTGSGGGAGAAACVGLSSSQLERLLRSTRIDGSWARASNVAIQPVSVCPEMRPWLAAALGNSGLGDSLRSAIAGDALLSASLSRTPYDAGRVFAVQRQGSQLTVFVY